VKRREFIAGLMFAAAMGRAQAQQTGKFTGSQSVIPSSQLPISIRRARGPS
jgi:hypothetical protein